MKDARAKVESFLARTRMRCRSEEMAGYCRAFTEEMVRGLSGRPSSLSMIPTYIEAERALPAGERVIALDAGGTNLRVASVSFDAAGMPEIRDLARHRMPGSDAEIGRDEFFRALADFVRPLAGKADRIGFCFSYPAEMTPEKDGRLIFFTKEVKARGVEGQMVGGNLRRALAASGCGGNHRIVLLNDTVATLLAGRNSMPGRRFDGYIGLVCGTGLNAAYVESNAAIRKNPELDPAGYQIINTELGGFGRGPQTIIDKEFNSGTETPGKYLNEKMISGAYLGGLCLAAAHRAAKEGVLSAETARELKLLPGLSTRELSDFIMSPTNAENPVAGISTRVPPEDARALYNVMDAVVERAAMLVAVDLCAILLKTGRGLDPRFPVCITVDGTTFWQLKDFRARVECFMRSFLTGGRRRSFEIAAAEDAPLIGAAIAGLTN